MSALAPGQAVLSAHGLGKRFGSRVALRDVSFDAHAGERIAVIGPNGAGKTTLLSILAGVERPSEGAVQCGSHEQEAGAAHGARSPLAARRPERGLRLAIGWAPQEPALYSKLSVAENLRLFARLEGVADPEAAVARMLEQSGLGERSDERVERLSGGNRQRVNVAISLLCDPGAVLLDEPSSALDPGQRERLWGFVGRLASRGTCVVFSTHIVAEAASFAERVLVLDRGDLRFDGAPAELAARGGGGDFEAAFVSFLAASEQPA